MRGIAICTYNRANNLAQIIQSVLSTKPSDARVVVCDDGSTDDTHCIVQDYPEITYIRGTNLGVGANKNRALFVLQECDFLVLLEDDLKPIDSGWFETYEDACLLSGIHHFVRVQDKEVEETVPSFTEKMKSKGFTPIYGPSPRGDLTFFTKRVLKKVGALNPQFKGVGMAHGEHTNRIIKAGLVEHPNHFVDIKESRDKFIQVGDTEGGRWLRPKREIKQEIKVNGAIAKKLRATGYIHHPLIFP